MPAETAYRQDIRDTTISPITKAENFNQINEVVGQIWAKPTKTASGDEKAYGDVRTSKDLSAEEKGELHERLLKMKAESEAIQSVKELGKTVCEALGFGDCAIFDSLPPASGSRIDTSDSRFSRTFPASPEAIKEKFQELYKEKH